MKEELYFLNLLDDVKSVCIYNENEKTEYNKDSQKFNDIIEEFKDMLKDYYEMPAFGVSIDEETKKEIQKGLWIELLFEKDFEHNGLPFKNLLINVRKDYSGFNLIRKYKDKYDGRCFYIDLIENNMENLYDTIIEK